VDEENRTITFVSAFHKDDLERGGKGRKMNTRINQLDDTAIRDTYRSPAEDRDLLREKFCLLRNSI